MAKLEELIQAFVTIIVSYHDSKQPSEQIEALKASEQERVQALLEMPFEEMVENLNRLIMTTPEDEIQRIPLLIYILNIINLLNKLVEHVPELNEEQLMTAKDKIVHLYFTVGRLLNGEETATSTFEYINEVEESDTGDIIEVISQCGFEKKEVKTGNNAVLASLLEAQLFKPLELPSNANIKEIEGKVGLILQEHNKVLTQRGLALEQRIQGKSLEEKNKLLIEEIAAHKRELSDIRFIPAVNPPVCTESQVETPVELNERLSREAAALEKQLRELRSVPMAIPTVRTASPARTTVFRSLPSKLTLFGRVATFGKCVADCAEAFGSALAGIDPDSSSSTSEEEEEEVNTHSSEDSTDGTSLTVPSQEQYNSREIGTKGHYPSPTPEKVTTPEPFEVIEAFEEEFEKEFTSMFAR